MRIELIYVVLLIIFLISIYYIGSIPIGRCRIIKKDTGDNSSDDGGKLYRYVLQRQTISRFWVTVNFSFMFSENNKDDDKHELEYMKTKLNEIINKKTHREKDEPKIILDKKF